MTESAPTAVRMLVVITTLPDHASPEHLALALAEHGLGGDLDWVAGACT